MSEHQNQTETRVESNYDEFYDPRLVAVYNTVCPLDGYEKFYIQLAHQLSARTIIDIGCGTGLVTHELAKRGYQMIGVEPSKLMLEVARKSPYSERIQWIEGDALSLAEFNADLAMMTGHVAQFHLEDEYWLKALKSIRRALRPGGYLAFESRNPAVQPWASDKKQQFTDWYTPGFRQKVTDPVKGPMEIWLEVVEVKDKSVTTDNHYLFTDTGEELLSRNTLRFRSKEELTQALERAGFSVEKVYGDWDGSTARPESPEFIFVAKRK
jgi:SAM-dependent methyltransferase